MDVSRPPPAKRGGNERTVVMREVVNGLMCSPPDATGAPSRRICHRKASTSICGHTTARCVAFITHLMCGGQQEQRGAQPPPLSTARAWKSAEKRACIDPPELRCG